MRKRGTNFIDITNQTFGMMTALSYLGKGFWTCKCEKCGNEKRIDTFSLRNKSPGCGVCSGKRMHGKSGTPEHRSYKAMKTRCYNPNNQDYHHYGGRGIKICDRWLESFENFLEDMGLRPTLKHSLDRIDVNGDYCPENCKWSTQKEQMNNIRPVEKGKKYEFNGMSKTMKEWSIETGLPYDVISDRLRRGWPIDKALTQSKQIRRE